MRTSSRSRRFVPSVDRLHSRLLLSDASIVITPMDPVPVGYSDGMGGDPSPSAPDTSIVITPMDPVPVGYSDGMGGDSSATVTPIAITTVGYTGDSTAPSWDTSAASMGDMLCPTS